MKSYCTIKILIFQFVAKSNVLFVKVENYSMYVIYDDDIFAYSKLYLLTQAIFRFKRSDIFADANVVVE